MSMLKKKIQDFSEYLVSYSTATPTTLKIEKSLSGIKDVDLKILSELDDETLLNFCVTNKYGSQLCQDEMFWKNRLANKYPDSVTFKGAERSWKSWYLNLTYFFDKYGNKFITEPGLNKELGMIEKVAEGGIKNLDLIHYFKFKYLQKPYPRFAQDPEVQEYVKIMRTQRALTNAIIGSLKAQDEKLLEYLISMASDRDVDWNDVVKAVIKMGNLKLVQRFVDASPLSMQYGSHFVTAIESGNEDIVDYFFSKVKDNYQTLQQGLKTAREYGHKKIINFLLSKGVHE